MLPLPEDRARKYHALSMENMRDIRLIAIDLDGTLLDDAKQVGAATGEALRRAARSGVKVVVATARPPRSVRQFYRQLELDTLQINYNGALIWDEPRSQAVFHQPMPGTLVQRIVAQLRALFPEILVSCEILDRWYTDRFDRSYTTQTGLLFEPDVIAPIEEFCDRDITKLMFLWHPQTIDAAEAVLRESWAGQIAMTRGDGDLIQIMGVRVSKAAALKKVAAAYGVEMAQVMAIGDAPNDMEMLSSAGVAVAVENADPLCKKVAHWIAPSNNHDGVAAALAKYLTYKAADGIGGAFAVRSARTPISHVDGCSNSPRIPSAALLRTIPSMSLPFLTVDFPGIGGTIKRRPEDFFVQEIPLYEPAGSGEHVYCEIQKVGLTTFEAVDRLARALNVNPRDIGYAGMKDAKAVTRQIFSILGTTPEQVMALAQPDMTVLWAARHGNKLRLGHLSANRFAVKIREVDPADVVRLRPVLDVLEKRGLPNYFGSQRFGRRSNNDQFGAALLRGDHAGLLKLLLGSPDPNCDDPQTLKARKTFDAGQLEESMHFWPRRSGMERRALARLIKTKKPGAAVRCVDQKLRRLWITALQSRLFNQVLAQRMQDAAGIDHLIDGDMAMKHENGACFHVQDAATEQPRCDAFEISPTGPLLGYRLSMPEGRVRQMEEAVFAAAGLKAGEFRQEGKQKVKGARRPLRVQPKDFDISAGVDEYGPQVTVAFTLPAGSFATVLLREVMKTKEDSD